MGHRLEEVHQAKAQFVLTSFPGLTMFTITTDHCKMLIKTEVSSQENVNCIHKDLNCGSQGICPWVLSCEPRVPVWANPGSIPSDSWPPLHVDTLKISGNWELSNCDLDEPQEMISQVTMTQSKEEPNTGHLVDPRRLRNLSLLLRCHTYSISLGFDWMRKFSPWY